MRPDASHICCSVYPVHRHIGLDEQVLMLVETLSELRPCLFAFVPSRLFLQAFRRPLSQCTHLLVLCPSDSTLP